MSKRPLEEEPEFEVVDDEKEVDWEEDSSEDETTEEESSED